MICRYCRASLWLQMDADGRSRPVLVNRNGSVTCIENGFGNHEIRTVESVEYTCRCGAEIHKLNGVWCAVDDGSQWCEFRNGVVTTANMNNGTPRHEPNLPDLSDPEDILKFLTQ